MTSCQMYRKKCTYREIWKLKKLSHLQKWSWNRGLIMTSCQMFRKKSTYQENWKLKETIYKWQKRSIRKLVPFINSVKSTSPLKNYIVHFSLKSAIFSDNDVMSRDGIMTSCHVTIFQHRPARYLKVDAISGKSQFPFIVFFRNFLVFDKNFKFFSKF